MTFFRHFIERDDFDTLVLTTSRHVDEFSLPYEPLRLQLPPWWDRACRTRLLPWLYPLQILGGHWLTRGRTGSSRIQEFKPDAVFTMAGNWDWTALAAQRLASKLGIPLVASFNDWFDYGGFLAHPRFRPMIERRFRRFYREADLALCTSEGMREALGDQPNAHVWYPTGAPMKEDDGYMPSTVAAGSPFVVFFGGSLGDWYGPMMESLVRECEQHGLAVQFRIFGSLEAWSREFDRHAREEGIFRGRVDFPTLSAEAAGADLLILPMGFGEDCAQVERTSFKTKFLDYLSFRRPILVWGPEYCSAVRVAREFDSAECVTDPSPAVCRKAIADLAASPERRRQLMGNAVKMYKDRFHPDRIHEGLVRKIDETVARHRLKKAR